MFVLGLGDLPNILQETDISVITEAQCMERWDDGQIGEFHVCVWEAISQDKGSCSVSCWLFAL